MKSRRLSIIFALVVFNAIFAGLAFADVAVPPEQKELNIVALGDSLTYGYPPPSNNGFPDFIAGAKNVDKFGGVGATTSILGSNIAGNIVNFSNKVKEADIVTVNIGSMDFLIGTHLDIVLSKFKEAAVDPTKLPGLVQFLTENPITPITQTDLVAYKTTLDTIIKTADTQTDAPIILYNLYNPIVVDPALNAALGGELGNLQTLVESQLALVNNAIAEVGGNNGVNVVDAHSAIGSNPAAFIIPFDIHPTVDGHQVLAKLSDTIIANLPVEDPSEEEPPVEEPGEDPPTEGPKENPTTQPPAAEQPKAETPKPTPVKAQAKAKVITSGSELPDTATPIYNYLVIGLAIAFVGMITFGIHQYHQKRNEGI